MKNVVIRFVLWAMLLLLFGWPSLTCGQGGTTNVSILWPRQGDLWDYAFSPSTLIKIKATARDPDGSIAKVEFFVETNLVGTATNPPFNVIWEVGTGVPFIYTNCQWILRAVVIGHTGGTSESTPVTIKCFTESKPFAVVEMLSPRNGEMFAVPAIFPFSAEVLASRGSAGPVEFFVGTNLVGSVDAGAVLTASTPPSSVTVSNLLEGEYKLSVQYRGTDHLGCVVCYQRTNTIRVVKLGLQTPRLSSDGRLQFDVVTAFPGKPTIIQTSPNLLDWAPVGTNQPSSNTFTFTEPSPATNSPRFYRVTVPPE